MTPKFLTFLSEVRAFKIVLAALLCLSLIPLMNPTSSFAASATVQLTGEDYYNGIDHTSGMTVNGNEATCLDHFKATPDGISVSSSGTISNQIIRKALYYGDGGPCDDGKWDRVQTAVACSMAYSGNGAANGSATVEAFYYAMDNYDNPPESFVVTLWSSASGYQDVATWEYNPVGAIEIQKVSSNTSLTTDNACYSLAGAAYGIYTDSSCKNLIVSLTTNSSGYATTSNTIPAGTYWVKETTAPLGYALDSSVYKVEVESESVSRVNGKTVSDFPQNNPVSLVIQKTDSDTGLTQAQGEASLEGAQFTLEYYDGFYSSVQQAQESGAATRTWVIETDDMGAAHLEEDYLVSGDDLYLDSTGTPTIPLGTLLIQETSAPQGYLLNDTTYIQHISASGTTESLDIYQAPTQEEQVISGGVEIQKLDAESGLTSSLGSASLEQTTYEIRSLNDATVRVNGTDYEKDQVVATITTLEGWASTGSNTLPFGTYSIQEIATGNGYTLNDTAIEFSITSEGEMVRLTEDNAIANQVVRGDLEFQKKDESDMSALANVPFKITSQTTGESHILVTDENGYASTSASYNNHTTNTNANDEAADGSYDTTAGIWFGLTQEGWSVEADDSLGALPYDTYDIEELPCQTNEGLQLVALTGIVISRDTFTVDLGTIDDPQASIATTARDDVDGDRFLIADTQATIIDRVTYQNLITGRTYLVSGTLMDKQTGEPLLIDGEEVTASATFIADTPSGYVELSFTFDASALGGKTLVVFETLTYDDREIATHTDLDDIEQSLVVIQPEIGTDAYDFIDNDKQISADIESIIVDTVYYQNLIPGKEYTLTGTLMDKETGEALLVDQEPFLASTTFIPQDSEGTVDVTFTFNSVGLENKTIVVFESLTKEGVEMAQHSDLDDTGQTVSIAAPQIRTSAHDTVDGDKTLVADKECTFIDTVTYEGLVIGKEYTVQGIVMDKGTGDPLLIDGENVVASTTFTPEETSGTIDVVFTFNTSLLAGKTVVVFETLTREDYEVASHSDLEDAAQTLVIVASSITTSAYDKTDQDRELETQTESTIVDTISYSNLIPGVKYVLVGTLMDKETGDPLLIDDKPITTTLTFTPEEAHGNVDLEFAFDSSGLAGKELVVFEVLYKDEVEVASHTDLTCAEQTVSIVDTPVPEITPTPESSPQTGDNATLIVTLSLLLLAGGLFSALAYRQDRKKKRTDVIPRLR